jgi:hypothetical protein
MMTLISALEAIAQNKALKEETNFLGRAEAIEFINFHILEQHQPQAGNLAGLEAQAEALRDDLEAINTQFLQGLRRQIISGSYTPALLHRQFKQYAGQAGPEPDYDGLDLLVNGLLRLELGPEAPAERDPESVFYQPTPARVVLELIDKAGIGTEDVFYDLGSGLGQTPILVSLLTGARSKGIEVEPAYHEYAQECARRLKLSQVVFVHQDARYTDFSEGTIFFMYTPFTGRTLQTVLDRLRGEAQKRPIKVCAYGPCARQVSASSWLRCVYQNTQVEEYQLAIFQGGPHS